MGQIFNRNEQNVNLPYNIIDTDDILFFSVLGRADDSGACLHPRVSSQLVHQSVVVRQYLTLVHYCIMLAL